MNVTYADDCDDDGASFVLFQGIVPQQGLCLSARGLGFCQDVIPSSVHDRESKLRTASQKSKQVNKTPPDLYRRVMMLTRALLQLLLTDV